VLKNMTKQDIDAVALRHLLVNVGTSERSSPCKASKGAVVGAVVKGAPAVVVLSFPGIHWP